MKIRKFEKLVISICMMIIVSLALVTATYAWYAGTDPTILEALNLTLDDKGDLKVEIVLENGERMDMSQVDANGAAIDLALSKLINIEENKLGPGAFGEVHIFISSRSATYSSYDIKIIPNCDLITNGDEDALELAKEHIRFYAAKTDEGYEKLIPFAEAVSLFSTKDEISDAIENDSNVVKENEPTIILISMEDEENALSDIEIMNDTMDDTENIDEPKEPEPLIQTKAVPTVTVEGITGAISSGEETEIVLYWYWPYEYDDVPDKTKISAQSEREYDLHDTVIGNYIQSIGFTFVVEGNTDEE